ncbi:4'-phosphopantetheinyl transferase family protein [Spirosoma pulveris]
MIGNDIVDLALAKRESNWRRRGYLDKIFTPHEQQLIRAANDPDQLVWLLWSMKESAYKLSTRHTHDRVFAPAKIVCHITSQVSESATGNVFYNGTCQAKSVITPRYVSTVAFTSDAIPALEQVIVRFDTMDLQTHQRQIRDQIRQHCARLFDIPEQEVVIAKDSIGAPLLTLGKSALVPLSISHHGFYGSFAIGPTGG